MKALLYKELKLAMHPICYVFIFTFPLLILIPSYPVGVGFIYVLSCYPILFLGANKGQQSNDLLFSTLLPIRKKDIVLARVLVVCLMHFVFCALLSALYPLAVTLRHLIISSGGDAPEAGLGLESFVSILGIAFIGFAIADLIFFPIYYKRGKSIVASTLLMILGFVVYIMLTTVVLPLIPGLSGYAAFFGGPLWLQFIVSGVGLSIYAGLHVLVYHISKNRLEKVDF